MNLSDHIRLSDLQAGVTNSNMDPEMKGLLSAIISRMDQFMVNVIVQLKAQPTIFTVNPATDTETVEGAKEGDVCIYKNAQGDVEISLFD
jgi:hypothetical protein